MSPGERSQEKPHPGRFRVGLVAQIGRKMDIVAHRLLTTMTTGSVIVVNPSRDTKLADRVL
jgi:hypothetical protein